MSVGQPILTVSKLSKVFQLRLGLLTQLTSSARSEVRAVDNIDLHLQEAEILALVGESGSGKTTVGKMVCLLEEPTSGEIRLDGEDIVRMRGQRQKRFRRDVQMIFQNPYESLDPRFSAGVSIAEPLRLHGVSTTKDRRERVDEALNAVELKPADMFHNRFPHELSGGQRQRIAIARALILNPRVIVADEPVSMLDVSIRSGIMNIMLDLRDRFSMTYLFITHDLAVARYMGDRIAVMYLGKIVEVGPTDEVIANPAHPYTRMLLAAVPEPVIGLNRERVRLKGEAAAVKDIPSGCRFHPRCLEALPECSEIEPEITPIGTDHIAACHLLGSQ